MGQKLLRDAQEKGKTVNGGAILHMVSLSGIQCFVLKYCVNTMMQESCRLSRDCNMVLPQYILRAKVEL